MKIQNIHYEDALLIRHKVLWPDKSVSFCKVEGDESANHYGAYLEGKLVCVASIYIEGNSARLRKFATLPMYQGRGIGSKIILHILSELKEKRIEYFWCDARKSAVSFYQKFGFEKQGLMFKKSNVSYYKMAIELAAH